jgi:hypothetical protein
MRAGDLPVVSSLLAMLMREYRHALRVADLEDGNSGTLAQQSGITAESAAIRVHREQSSFVTGTC